MNTTFLIFFSSIAYFFIILAVVSQKYSTSPQHEVYVIVGNSALVKCEIPSFVADFVSVVSWVENNGVEYFPNHIGILFFLFRWETQAVTYLCEVC